MPLLIPQILHHGAVDGVTGSCHEYRLSSGSDKLALLIDFDILKIENQNIFREKKLFFPFITG